MCKFCEKEKPLTNKIYHSKIKFIKDMPVLIVQHKMESIDFSTCNKLTEEDKRMLSQPLAVEINYRPMCGRELNHE